MALKCSNDVSQVVKKNFYLGKIVSAHLSSMQASMTRVCGALASRLAHDRDTRRLRAMVAIWTPCTNASAMTSRCSVRALVMPAGKVAAFLMTT